MDIYRAEVIDPGDQASRLAKQINYESFSNCPAVDVYPHQPGNFRGPVGYSWKRHILEQMLGNRFTLHDTFDWVMLEEIENDGAGGKPQFFSLIGTPKVFEGLGWEIITMTADDFARSGRFPAIIVNELNVKRLTKGNFPLVEECYQGFGRACRQAGLVSLTGETAVMKHSITAFCDQDSDAQLILTWGAACVGLAHREKLIDGSGIKPDMPIVGFWEPGYRCNGGTFFTNLLLSVYGSVGKIRASEQAMSFVYKLTVPSVSYARLICRFIGWNDDGSIRPPLARIEGIAHITGGGVWGKFGELLPEGVGADLSSMPRPTPVLLEAQELSWTTKNHLSDWRAYSTLHGGCGMLVVCATDADAKRVLAEAATMRILAYPVGITTKSPERLVTITSRFKEGKLLRSDQPE